MVRRRRVRGARQSRLASTLASYLELAMAVQASGTGFGKFVQRFLGGTYGMSPTHCGDLLPIPPVTADQARERFAIAGPHVGGLVTLANFSLAGVNFLQ